MKDVTNLEQLRDHLNDNNHTWNNSPNGDIPSFGELGDLNIVNNIDEDMMYKFKTPAALCHIFSYDNERVLLFNQYTSKFYIVEKEAFNTLLEITTEYENKMLSPDMQINSRACLGIRWANIEHACIINDYVIQVDYNICGAHYIKKVKIARQWRHQNDREYSEFVHSRLNNILWNMSEGNNTSPPVLYLNVEDK